MKDFDYYQNPDMPYFGYEERKQYEQNLRNQINETPMTAYERQEALDQSWKDTREYSNKQNAPYVKKQKDLEQEFWIDAREELGYDQFLSEKGCAILEQKGWEDGHSSGFSEIYGHLYDLTQFAREMIENQKESF